MKYYRVFGRTRKKANKVSKIPGSKIADKKDVSFSGVQTSKKVKDVKVVQNNDRLNYTPSDDEPLIRLSTRANKEKAKYVSKTPGSKSADKKDESFSDVQTNKEVQNNKDEPNAETELSKED